MPSDESSLPAGSYPGHAFHPQLPGGRAAGTLRLDSGTVRFESPAEGVRGRVIEMPLRGLEMRLGGAADRIVFFRHPTLPDITLYTSEHAVLANPLLLSEPGVASQISGIYGKKRRGRAITAAVLLVLLGAVLGLLALKDPLVGVVADHIPADLEIRLGELVFRQIEASTRLVDDAEVQRQLDDFVAPLLAALPDTGYPFRFHLAEDPTLNAFALPGGHVVLHSGLLLRVGNREEALGVLAHEIAHVTRRHSLRQLISSLGLYALVQTFLGDVSGLVAVIADNGLKLMTLEHSRDAERDADDTGWGYLLTAGINPHGMITMFEKLQEEQEKMLGDAAAVSEALAFLSTHPSSQERIERLAARWEALGRHDLPQPDDGFLTFQALLRQRLAAVPPADPAAAAEDGPGLGDSDPSLHD